MRIDGDETQVVWRAHWPQFTDCCTESTKHRMEPTAGMWVCQGCGQWFDLKEQRLVAQWMGAAESFLQQGGIDGGSAHPLQRLGV